MKRCLIPKGATCPDIACDMCSHFGTLKYVGFVQDLNGAVQTYETEQFDTYEEAIKRAHEIAKRYPASRRAVGFREVPDTDYDLHQEEWKPSPFDTPIPEEDIEVINTAVEEREAPTMSSNYKVRELIEKILNEDALKEAIIEKVRDNIDYSQVAEEIKAFVLEGADVDSIAEQMTEDMQEEMVNQLKRDIEEVGIDNHTESIRDSIELDDVFGHWDEVLEALDEYL